MTDRLLKGYKGMMKLRTAGEELVKLYLEKKIMSMVHFYVGQEAVAVGVCDNLLPEDKVLGTHRSHGHYLAKGGSLNALVAELLGKKSGAARGKGGSMHLVARSVNFVGSSPILASAVPIAAGVAFEKKYRKEKGIAVAFFGDGAAEEGVVYETLNLAALYHLPLLLVIENNKLSITTKLKDRRSAHYDSEKIATGLGLAYLKADGNDYEDVSAKAKEAVSLARKNHPVLLECLVYRHMAHSTPLFDEAYREEDVLEERLAKDPLKRLARELEKKGISKKELQDIEDAARADAQEAIRLAYAAPYPPKEDLFTDLYAR